MRWILFVALVGCTADQADPGIDQVYSGEVLHNGGFELLDNTGWIAGWNNEDRNPNGKIVVESDTVKFGAYAVQWQIEAAGDGREYWIEQDVDGPQIQGNRDYELTGWFMSDHTGDVAFNYFVYGEPGDSPDITTVPNPPMGPTEANVWQHFAYTISIPAAPGVTSWQVGIHSIKFTGEPELLTVDAISLHPLL